MQQIMLFAAAVALLALAALAIRAYLLVKRTHELLDAEVAEVVRTLGGAARGVEQAVGKLDKGLEALSSTLDRVDRVTQRLEPEYLAHTVAQPALAKIGAWLGGLRKGLARARRGGRGEAEAAEVEDVTES